MRWPSAYSLAMSTTVRRRGVSVVALMLAPARARWWLQSARRRRARPARRRPDRAARSATARLRLQRQVVARPVGGEDRDAVRLGAEARARLGHVVGDEQVDALAAELVGRPVERAGLGREPDEDRARVGAARRVGAPSLSRPRAIRAISASRSGVGSSSSVSASPRGELVVRPRRRVGSRRRRRP